MAGIDIKPAINPDTYPAKELERNQTPIINPAIRGIDNLETIERPTGDRQSSPKV